MYILNITFNVELSVLDNWKKFMASVFIPYANVKEQFVGHNYYEVMVEDPNASTYSYQLIAENMEAIESFEREIFPALQREMTQAFSDKVLLFSTVLKEEKIFTK